MTEYNCSEEDWSADALREESVELLNKIKPYLDELQDPALNEIYDNAMASIDIADGTQRCEHSPAQYAVIYGSASALASYVHHHLASKGRFVYF